MADGLQFQVIGASELVTRLGNVPPVMRARVGATIRSLIARVAALAKAKAGTGPLGRSIQTDFIDTAEEITGEAFSEGVVYAAIQEYGGTTGPHEILPVNAAALRFISPGKLPISKSGMSEVVFAKRVMHPGSRIPEKAYMRGALANMRLIAIAELRIAAGEGVQLALEV